MKALHASLLLGLLAVPAVHAAQAAVPAAWHGTLPHEGDLGRLQHWWSQFDDPLLARLMPAPSAPPRAPRCCPRWMRALPSPAAGPSSAT